MSAPVAPNKLTEPKPGEVKMSTATNVRVLPRPEKKTLYERTIEGINMTVQKANSPSMSISPATLGLLFTIILQLGITIWWASGINKELEHKSDELKAMKSDAATMKVYIDTTREKQVKLEAAIENQEKQLQQLNILVQMKGAK